MDLISNFIARYVKEYDFYDQAARLVKQRLETNLRESGVRCMVTYRAKDVSRLEAKCRQRDDSRHYASAEEIFDDIADLAGVRVALYFPAERHHVDSAINNLFRLLEPRKDFPNTDSQAASKRFRGYYATHYRVQLKEDELSEPDRRYAIAKVEIQVASVLMHAWSEVEHDLVYKPLEGDLSEDEYAILDQLNGMVIAGEIALETLQRAGKRRVAEGGRTLMNHYELAAHLLNRADSMSDEPISDSGLGRVDLLFTLLSRLKINTPAQLTPYLQALHGNLELRPLAEQVIDGLLAEDKSRYDIYRAIQEEGRKLGREQEFADRDVYRQVGIFLTRWVELENLVRALAPTDNFSGHIVPIFHQLERLEVLDPSMRREIDLLRRLRNNVVHRAVIPGASHLTEAAQQVESITEEIRRRSSQED
jgi:ppGpp synthetase/RelA/SpoT-type nucleotidyltranferase